VNGWCADGVPEEIANLTDIKETTGYEIFRGNIADLLLFEVSMA